MTGYSVDVEDTQVQSCAIAEAVTRSFHARGNVGKLLFRSTKSFTRSDMPG